MAHEIASSVASSEHDGDSSKALRSFNCAYIALVLSTEIASERIVEYGVNVTDGTVFPWNPFELNFARESDAEDAARQYLLDNPDEQHAVVFELVVVDDQIASDRILSTIYREDLVDACVPQ